jgi:hypothetical protein
VSVQEKGDMVDESRENESKDEASNVVRDAVLAVLDKDVKCDVEPDVLECT